MKKVFLALVALFLTTGAFAQMRNFDWGVKAGLNIAGITNMPDDAKMKAGFHAGVFVEWRFNEWIGLQPELMYSGQGNRYKYNNGNLKVTNRLNYINLPVLAKIYVLERLSVDIGPQFGVLLSANQKVKNDVGNSTITSDYDIDDAKNFDVSIPIGLTYALFDRWDFSARYNIGITKIWDTTGDNPKNSVIQLSVGYRF